MSLFQPYRSQLSQDIEELLQRGAREEGFSLLIAVILVTAAVSTIIIVALSFARSSIKDANLVHESNRVYYAVEGAMYETLQHMSNDPTWPETDYQDNYSLGGVRIEREIAVGDSSKEIDITAQRGAASRRLLADVTVDEGGRLPIDVMLTLDVSGSMSNDGCEENIDGVDEWDEVQPAGDMKVAAIRFVNRLEEDTDWVGLTKFSTDASTLIGLTDNYSDVQNRIGVLCNNWGCGGGCEAYTNIGDGIRLSREELDGYARPDSVEAIVLLSDGKTNRPGDDPRQYALDQANLAANSGFSIYTISLGQDADQALMEQIAQITGGLTFYAPTSDDLDDIFAEINRVLESVVNYELREGIPE